MFVELLLAVVVSLVAWVVLRWRKVRTFWAERGVPHDPPHPIYGSLDFLQKENPAMWMRRIYTRFSTPYMGIWVFWRPGLMVNSPELARRILVKDSDNFRNRHLGSGKTDPLGALNLFAVDDPLWSSVRRRLTSVFTAAKLRSLEGLVRGKADDIVTRIGEEMLKDPEQLNLRTICTDFTTDVVGEAAFGIKSEAARTGDSVIRKITRDFMKFSVFRGLSWSSIFFFPSLVDLFGFSFFPKDTTEYLRKLFRLMVEQRGGLDRPVAESRDLLDALINMRQDAAKDNEEMSEELLLAQAAVFLQAGFDTSGSALAFLIYELAHRPHLQDRLYEELQAAMKQHGTDKLNSNQLSELPYLNATIKEIVRKWSPMGWLDRIATHDYKIDDHLTIPAGTIVYVNAIGMHWDAAYFPQPEEFNPDRFLPENEKNIKPYSYLPFGDGPRNCIGMRFAFSTLRLGLSTIFLKYSVRPQPGACAANDCKIEKRGLLLMPDNDEKMSVIFTARK